MMHEGRVVGDGSWELNVLVTDLKAERKLRVDGDMSIGNVMIKLVESLDVAMDWSDHGFWWPQRNSWLLRTHWTLDKCGVQADAQLHFTPTHKNLRVQLPDLQLVDLKVDFSYMAFNAIMSVCAMLGIRHPEELSFMKKVDERTLKRGEKRGSFKKKKGEKYSSPASSANNSDASYPTTPTPSMMDGTHTTPRSASMPGSPYRSAPHTPGTPLTPGTPSGYNTYPRVPSYNGTSPVSSSYSLSSFPDSPYSDGSNLSALSISPAKPSSEAVATLHRPKNYVERARLNSLWLNSSRSLMEQGIRENDIILLRFKYYSFFDLNPKYDAVRINQIYEQAKWSLLTEGIECTEEEAMMFAALQLQVNLQSAMPQPDMNNANDSADDIDAALTDLQVSLEGSAKNSAAGDITQIPELADWLRFFKPKKFTLKSYKRYWFTFKDTHLAYYHSPEEASGAPIMRVNLRGCEVTPDVNISSEKYCIKLLIPSTEGMNEVWIRADSETQYARWMAACRLAAKGKTMADATYESEVQSITNFLGLQHPKEPVPSVNISNINIEPQDFVSQRHVKKFKLTARILEAHANVANLALMEAKLNYIRAWQALPEFGITHFVVRFRGNKKEDLLGVAFNRIMRMDLHTGDALKTWRYNSMKHWNVNWEVKEVLVQFEDEQVSFACLSADCKIVHEFIGGYIFNSMRSKDQNQTLNEELFHKLTGGWETI
ncbi:PREDICTED: fermitin family homolog 2-like isoform X4 [Branchiostoma belcheri]|uniref:Fermitin family homolog 2-like isoform X4 n=1 Tax=Branchiostoma belcheri TaxID=7741 RepID=A0A6P4YSI2_BRABE|nr:PREDICTED: fermitin family homolog 2-like isoform X4 [Branchiostoma belcheri]